MPGSVQDRIRNAVRRDGPAPVAKALAAGTAVLVLVLSLSTMLAAQARRPLPRALIALNEVPLAFGVGSLFHLFPTMQTERQELRIFGSYDGHTWEPYEFRYKPDVLDKAPEFIVPHQPRLDWMMWFLPPQWPDTTFWFGPFLESLRQNRTTVTRLLARNPFEGKSPPRLLRVLAYRYHFTTPQERARTGNWWKAEYLGEYPDIPPRRP
jgi:hypothetical protein